MQRNKKYNILDRAKLREKGLSTSTAHNTQAIKRSGVGKPGILRGS